MERRNEHYSNKPGHHERGKFAKSLMRILHLNPDQPLSRPSMQIGIPKETKFVMRRSMLRTPDSGRK